MQSRSEECCDRAAECSKIAKRHSGLIKQQYEQIADQWLYLAEHTLILGTRCSFAPHRIRALRAARLAGLSLRLRSLNEPMTQLAVIGGQRTRTGEHLTPSMNCLALGQRNMRAR